jgi:hypothetical protein
MCKVSPDTANEKQEIAEQENWSATPYDSHGLGEEARHSNDEDTPAKATIEGVIRHVELFTH